MFIESLGLQPVFSKSKIEKFPLGKTSCAFGTILNNGLEDHSKIEYDDGSYIEG